MNNTIKKGGTVELSNFQINMTNQSMNTIKKLWTMGLNNFQL